MLNLHWPHPRKNTSEQASASPGNVLANLSAEIMAYTSAHPEGTPVCPKTFLHLGDVKTIGEAMSGLAESGKLSQVCEGIFVQPVETRFGTRSPDFGKGRSPPS